MILFGRGRKIYTEIQQKEMSYKKADRLELEKGDGLAIFLAGLIVFMPFIILFIGSIYLIFKLFIFIL